MTNALLYIFCYTLGIVVSFQCLLFIVAIAKRNNGVADIGWGIGFILIAIISYLFKPFFIKGNPDWTSQIVMLFLVIIWALRLSIYLSIRNWNKPEDWRYAKWRQEWGKFFYWRSFLQVFILQGIFMVVIGSPIILSNQSPITFRSPSYLPQVLVIACYIWGLLIWIIGFFFEAVGDYQLSVFKKDPSNKGRVMRYGIWKYTRHPNYFGEASMWWGIFLLSCVSAHGIVGILLRMIGPATITFMLLRVSGVTMLESKYKGNKEYEDYQQNTSALLPMRPKKS